ncbi:MAG: acyl-CoA dehydrogenase family protein [Hyphomicrobiaceae bacterium]
MQLAATLPDIARTPVAAPPLSAKVRAIVDADLTPIVTTIDRQGVYPEAVMRKLGAAGAYAQHLPVPGKDFSLSSAIDAMSIVSEACLSTAFCTWCQDAFAWYVANSDNDVLKSNVLGGASTGAVLGGTGLSNPMKHFFGIEPLRLKGTRVDGGYRVKGALPWVSNLGPDHHFGAVFERDDKPGHYVMAVVPCASEGLTLANNSEFVALDGTRTFAVQMRDVFVSDDVIVGDPIDAYLKKIRAGFVLLQSGMAFGLIEGAIKLMEQARASLHHVNKYLPEQPEQFRDQLSQMKETVTALCETPYDPSPAYWRKVVETRLAAGDATVAAAHAAMLHQGARGYVINGAAQRRLREAYFVAIVTPATKQLRKMLAEMPAC